MAGSGVVRPKREAHAEPLDCVGFTIFAYGHGRKHSLSLKLGGRFWGGKFK